MTIPTGRQTAHELLRALYAAALDGARPGPATAAALSRASVAPGTRAHVLALGKASRAMSVAAVETLTALGANVVGGLVIGPTAAPAPHAAMATEVGDHPVPGPRSLASAEALASASAHVEPGDTAIVLLSGGASSLAAAPVPGITLDDLRALTSLLLSAGVDIATTNTIRKRFLRWGAGRLAAALSPARVVCLAISDVPGDDIASIGSGPCSGDALSATELTSRLVDLELWARMPASMRDHLGRVERGELAETPKPHDTALAGVETSVILDNGDALRAVVSHARLLGLPSVTLGQWPLGGEAAECGARVAAQLAEVAALPGSIRPACIIWGGETTVTLGPSTPSDALGGRSQELALGAARWLDRTGSRAAGLALLAAGTDGRDGPTDAAGAIVDASSWQMIRRAGRDPAADLRAHRAYQSLDAIDALLRPGLTGTNVMDVVIGVAVS